VTPDKDPDTDQGGDNPPPPDPQQTFFNVLEKQFKPIRKNFNELLENTGFLDPSLPTEDKLSALRDVNLNLKAMVNEVDGRIQKLTKGGK